jgi:hypothetical protein
MPKPLDYYFFFPAILFTHHSIWSHKPTLLWIAFTTLIENCHSHGKSPLLWPLCHLSISDVCLWLLSVGIHIQIAWRVHDMARVPWLKLKDPLDGDHVQSSIE